MKKQFVKVLYNMKMKYFSGKDEMEKKLMNKLKIEKLEIIDLSGNCGTSFQIKIKSSDFNGKNVISQHRMVNEILKDELKTIHALQLKTEATDK